MLFNNLHKYNQNIALINEQGMNVTYEKLINDADQMANQIGRRCVVFLICSNCIESVVGYVGALRNDIVPVLISHDIDQTLFEALYAAYQPSYIWHSKDKHDMNCFTNIYEYENYVLSRCNDSENYRLFSDLALLLTTSGSTGSPKLVRQSSKNILSNTKSIIEYLKITSSDRAITTLPMNYTYGLSILNTHLYSGATIILTDRTLMDKSFWQLLKDNKATTFGGVPYIYDILKKLRFNKMELPSLRYITQAGGKLSKEMAEEFYDICKDKDMQMIIMYGQTEATARMSYLPWNYARSKSGSIGVAIPGGTFELVDTEDNIISEAEVAGELLYHGDNVTLGYAENYFDLEKGDENQGVLHTGDIAKRDKDGFYYIVGRKKRFLKLFGNRVNLDEVENLLKKENIENICVGEDDHLRIYITDESYTDAVKDFIINHTGISKGGFSVHYIEKIPRNESGKVLYSALQNK